MRSLLAAALVIVATPALAFAQDPGAKTGRSPFGDPQAQPPLGPSLLPPSALPPAAPRPVESPPPEPSPGEIRMRIAEGLARSARAGYPLYPAGEDQFVYDDGRFWLAIDRDGSFEQESGSRWSWLWLDGSVPGQDTYRLEKKKILEATFEMRYALSQRDARERMARALDELPGTLDGVWRDLRRTEPERRRLLWELWEECDETTSGGLTAREIIGEFLRAQGIGPSFAGPIAHSRRPAS